LEEWVLWTSELVLPHAVTMPKTMLSRTKLARGKEWVESGVEEEAALEEGVEEEDTGNKRNPSKS
jgi:hypothetical protein